MPAVTSNEATFALPTLRLLMSVALSAALSGAGWVAVTLALGQPVDVQWAGVMGAGVVLVVCLLGVLAMAPWRARPTSTWMTLWLAGTVLRMLAAPALTFLLYSATPLNAVALTLAVAVAYLIVLLTETVTIAHSVSRATA